MLFCVLCYGQPAALIDPKVVLTTIPSDNLSTEIERRTQGAHIVKEVRYLETNLIIVLLDKPILNKTVYAETYRMNPEEHASEPSFLSLFKYLECGVVLWEPLRSTRGLTNTIICGMRGWDKEKPDRKLFTVDIMGWIDETKKKISQGE